MKKDLLKILLLFLLPAVLWLFVNASINRHNHYLSGGYIISHAHPYEKSPTSPDPGNKHHHSGIELFLLSFISDPDSTGAIVFILVLFLLAIIQLLSYRHELVVPVREHYQVRNYHAPPFL